MPVKAASLLVDIRAGIANLQTDMDKAHALVESGVRKIENTLKTLGVAVGAYEFKELIMGAVEFEDSLQKLSQRLGITTEELSALQGAAKYADLSMEDMATTLKRMANAMQGAAGGAAQQRAVFDAMGLSVKDATGALKSSDDMLKQIADKFAGYRDGVAKTALANDIFGKSGERLIPLLNQGAEGIERVKAAIEEMHGTVTGGAAESAERFNDTIKEISLASASATRQFVDALLPAMQQLAAEFRNLQRDGGDRTWINSLASGVAMVVDSMKILYQIVYGIFNDVSRLGNMIMTGWATISIIMGRGTLDEKKEALNQLAQQSAAEDAAMRARLASVMAMGPTLQKAVDDNLVDPLRKFTDKQREFIEKSRTLAEEMDKQGLSIVQKRAAMLALANAYFPTKPEAPVPAKTDAAAEAEKRKYIAALQAEEEKLAVLNNQTERERLEIKLTTGSLKDLLPEHKNEIRVYADKIDAIKQYRMQKELEYGALTQGLEVLAKVDGVTEDFARAQHAANDEEKFQISLIGQTVEAQRRMTAVRLIDLQVRAAIKALGDIEGLTPDELFKRSEAIRAAGEKAKQVANDVLTVRISAERDWVTGSNQAIDDYLRSTSDAAQMAKTVWTTLFKGVEDVIYNFVRKGKITIHDFVNAVKDMLARIAAQQITLRILGAVGLSGATGSAAAGAAGSAAAGAAGSAAGSGLGFLGSAYSTFSSGYSGAGGGISGLATGATSVVDSAFQNIGSQIGSQWIADIGNYNWGVPVVSGMMQILSGNVAGGVGSMVGGALGSYFGPIGTVVGSWLGSQVFGSLFGDSGHGPKQSEFSYLGAERGFTFSNIGGPGQGLPLGENEARAYQQHLTGTYSAAVLNRFAGVSQDLGPNPGINAELDAFKKNIEPLMQSLDAQFRSLHDTFIALGKSVPDDAIMSLIDVLGNLGVSTDQVSAYYKNFYTQQEVFGMQTNALAAQFQAAGLTMPATRAAFRDMVDSLDLTTDSGRGTYAVLMRLSSAFAMLVPAAADATAAISGVATELYDFATGQKQYEDLFHTADQNIIRDWTTLANKFSALHVQVPRNAADFQQLVDAARAGGDATKQLYQALLEMAPAVSDVWKYILAADQSAVQAAQQRYDTAKANQTTAEGNLRTAYQNEVTLQNNRANATKTATAALLQAYNTQAAALQQTIDKWKAAAATLRTYAASLNTAAGSTLDPRRVFQNLVTQAKGGDQNALAQLPQAGEALRAFSEATSSTSTQYMADIAAIQNDIESVAQYADQQQTTAEQQLDQLKAQVSALIDISGGVLTVNQAIAALQTAQQAETAGQAALYVMHDQVAALITINESVLSVAAAIGALNAARAATAAAGGGLARATAMQALRNIDINATPAYGGTMQAAAQGDPGTPGFRSAVYTQDTSIAGSHTGVGEAYTISTSGGSATLHFPDYTGGASHTSTGATVEDSVQALIDAYGLVPVGDGSTYIRTRAEGGYTAPGLVWAGEQGPELIDFKSPGRVYDAKTSRAMMGGGSSAANDDQIRLLRDEVRAGQIAIAQNTAIFRRITEKWDNEGMPAVRT